jgi:ketosteroid isomerase-like protein
MRMSYVVLCLLMAAFAGPAAAAAADADQNLRHEVEKIGSAYAESFDRQDGEGIAALYATGGMHVNPAGPRSDIAEFYEGAFKAGFNHEQVTVDRVWPLGTDGALALGEYRITGKNKSGAPIEIGGRWTAVYVNEGGKLKIRMLSAFPKAPPPK